MATIGWRLVGGLLKLEERPSLLTGTPDLIPRTLHPPPHGHTRT